MWPLATTGIGGCVIESRWTLLRTFGIFACSMPRPGFVPPSTNLRVDWQASRIKKSLNYYRIHSIARNIHAAQVRKTLGKL